jgi:hypothetical protein
LNEVLLEEAGTEVRIRRIGRVEQKLAGLKESEGWGARCAIRAACHGKLRDRGQHVKKAR